MGKREQDDDKIEQNGKSSKKLKKYDICPICYRNLTSTIKTVTVPCFHTFCYQCLIHWIKIKQVCPVCQEKLWIVLYSIKSEDEYKIVKVRENSLQLDCDMYIPHLFLNDKGEYECTISETNRIRERLGLSPLEE